MQTRDHVVKQSKLHLVVRDLVLWMKHHLLFADLFNVSAKSSIASKLLSLETCSIQYAQKNITKRSLLWAFMILDWQSQQAHQKKLAYDMWYVIIQFCDRYTYFDDYVTFDTWYVLSEALNWFYLYIKYSFTLYVQRSYTILYYNIIQSQMEITYRCTMYIVHYNISINYNYKTWSWNAMLNPPLWQLLRKTDGIGRQWWWCIHLKISLKGFKFPWGFFNLEKNVFWFSDYFLRNGAGKNKQNHLTHNTNPNSNPAALLSSQVSIRLWISA